MLLYPPVLLRALRGAETYLILTGNYSRQNYSYQY